MSSPTPVPGNCRLHWVVNNIPAASEGLARASGGHTLVEYMGPAPPMGTHRYIFLAYQQPGDAPMTVRGAPRTPTDHPTHHPPHLPRALAPQHNRLPQACTAPPPRLAAT